MSDSNSSSSEKSNQVIEEFCHEIKKICEKRKCIKNEIELKNYNTMYKLNVLLSPNQTEPKENCQSLYVIRYLCNNDILPIQLTQILRESEDMQFCMCIVNIIYKLITNNDVDNTKIKNILSTHPNLNNLLETMYSLHTRFCGNLEYNEAFPEMHTKILHIIVTLCKVNICKKLIAETSDSTIRFIGQLISVVQKNKEMALNLLYVLKLICIKKDNSDFLASKQFLDSMVYVCKLTQKTVTVVLIFKLMSRSAIALNQMSHNDEVINLLLDLANYNGKKQVNKRNLMTILYRLTKSAHGLQICMKKESYHKLLSYFMKNENPEVFSNRMGTIKAYTILNRCIPKIAVPSVKLNMQLQLAENIKFNKDSDSEESNNEIDDTDEENEEVEYESSNEETSSSDAEMNSKRIFKAFNSRMKKFFIEFQYNNIANYGIPQLEIYKNINSYGKYSKSDICNLVKISVKRPDCVNSLAYPDELMLEEDIDKHFLNPSTNYFSVDYLTRKLQRAKDTLSEVYNPELVYDEDGASFITDSDEGTQQSNILKFESRFECGNLRCAKQIGKYEYEILMKSDVNSHSGHQWYYFCVTNMIPSVRYIFNIINFLKINSLYNHGMQPVMFSVMDYKLNGTGWKRAGDNVIYYGNNYTDENYTKQYRTLSFSLVFPYSNDKVYLAYHYPYTYTRLMTKLYIINSIKFSNTYIRIDKLCKTGNLANEIPLVTITSLPSQDSSTSLENRKIVIITARVHPGESNSSWIMEGILNFLLDETNVEAVAVKNRYIFKIIPMLNPEGVIHGNSRNGITGCDLNRCWIRPNKTTCPEIYYTKKLVEHIKKMLKQEVATFIDIHGHSRKKYFFFYGCNSKMSWNKKDRKNIDLSETLKVLPKMIQSFNPHIRLNSCRYKIQKKRESTARVVMWREFKIQQSFTLECSYCSGDSNQTIDTKTLTDIGASIVQALGAINN